MSDPAVEQDGAEAASLFSHPTVAPEATAAYGDHPDQVIDFYGPKVGSGPAPLVVVLHGGAWRARYDRQHATPFVDFLARRGFAVANVEYRRGGTLPHQGQRGPGVRSEPAAGRWPETFDDVADAMDALPALVKSALPQADPARVVLTGHSAGGQLALWAAARHLLPVDAARRLPEPPALRGVVALAPIADFSVARELDVCSGAGTQLLGGAATFEERRRYADPALLLPTDIATTVVHGRADIVVPPLVSESYVQAAALAGEMVGLTLLDGVGHFPLIDPAADACAVVAEEIAQLGW
ncbi:alpha/beta hydrolase family protein [Streptomyces sp. NPDC006879]|uniref:alpha/beta hydrolase family protein n=1 Tax=Streptomyces sp. NPDC006879 TaxID=3364767 RepID=UPI0036C66C11